MSGYARYVFAAQTCNICADHAPFALYVRVALQCVAYFSPCHAEDIWSPPPCACVQVLERLQSCVKTNLPTTTPAVAACANLVTRAVAFPLVDCARTPDGICAQRIDRRRDTHTQSSQLTDYVSFANNPGTTRKKDIDRDLGLTTRL